MSLPSEPTHLPQGKEVGNGSPAERSEPLLSSQESHLRPNRRAPDGESSTIHPTVANYSEPSLLRGSTIADSRLRGLFSLRWLSALKSRALPLAVLSLVLNLILISVIIVMLCSLSTPAADPVAACPDGWVGYLGKCYYFSEAEANWTDSQKNCSALGASLPGIDTQQEMDFLARNQESLDHWIGLHREPDQAWKWANDTEFNNWFPIVGGAQCAFLSHNSVSSSGCSNCQPWICSKPA
ncbi:early activation antigen CD69-like isoform X1 [Pelodiscus sinensis]|uniref:early activation antigen CD69-like isoform X1 n=1 Tax=Pelodiscus sinensis TaxID=13735 RepID=UPI003F6BCE01